MRPWTRAVTHLTGVDGEFATDRPAGVADLAWSPGSTSLVVIVQGDDKDCRLSGLGFVSDVLQANRVSALSVTLGPADGGDADTAAPVLADAAARLRKLLDGLARHPGRNGRPVALMGIGSAVPACIAVAAQAGPLHISALLLLDGPVNSCQDTLVQLGVPTLMLVGRTDAVHLAQHLAAADAMAAPHRLVLLSQSTRPVSEPGALESVACAAVAWIRKAGRLRPAGRPARSEAA